MCGSTGRYLNTKDNIQGVLTVNGIQVVYNVIKKRMEIDVPNTKFIADMKEEAALIEIEDRAINMGIPHTRVRDYLKVLAVEWNPVKAWMESRKWDGRSRLQEFLDTIGSPENEKLKEMLMKKWLISCCAAACEEHGVSLEGILVFTMSAGRMKATKLNLTMRMAGAIKDGKTLEETQQSLLESMQAFKYLKRWDEWFLFNVAGVYAQIAEGTAG